MCYCASDTGHLHVYNVPSKQRDAALFWLVERTVAAPVMITRDEQGGDQGEPTDGPGAGKPGSGVRDDGDDSQSGRPPEAGSSRAGGRKGKTRGGKLSERNLNLMFNAPPTASSSSLAMSTNKEEWARAVAAERQTRLEAVADWAENVPPAGAAAVEGDTLAKKTRGCGKRCRV